MSGKKTLRKTPGSLQRLAEPTHRADVPGRGALRAHQRCTPVLGTQAHSPLMQSHAHTRVHLRLRRRGASDRDYGCTDPAPGQYLLLSLIHISEPTRLGMISY